MKHTILEKIRESIKKHNMISPGDGIIVGLSGGPDSVCLFHSLCMLKEELQIGDITAVHINHCLRGEESDGDEAYARSLAEGLGSEFIVFRYDVNAIAAKNGEGTEEAGRRLRYAAFEKIRKQRGAARIAVAHNMNDQAETLMMRIMRGTGLRGLSGIDHVRADGVVIRPVLDLKRTEIELYCRNFDLEPHIDSTNAKAIYTRNKIRLQLLPMMADFNPGVVDALVRLSSQAREDEEYLMSVAMGFVDGCAGDTAEDEFTGKEKQHRGLTMYDATDLKDVINLKYNNELVSAKNKIENTRAENQQTDGITSGRRNTRRWNENEKSLMLDGFAELHPSIAKRVIMLCAARAGMEQNTSMTAVEKVLELASAGAEAKETDIADGYYARISYGKLWILKREKRRKGKHVDAAAAEEKQAKAVELPLDLLGNIISDSKVGSKNAANVIELVSFDSGSGSVVDGFAGIVEASESLRPEKESARQIPELGFGAYRIRMSIISGKERSRILQEIRKHKGAGMQEEKTVRLLLDLEKLTALGSVVIRNRQPGDRIRPIGMKGSKKLQDFFTDRKVPKHMRDGMLLLVSGGRVIAAGSEVSAECPVTAETKNILLIEY